MPYKNRKFIGLRGHSFSDALQVIEKVENSWLRAALGCTLFSGCFATELAKAVSSDLKVFEHEVHGIKLAQLHLRGVDVARPRTAYLGGRGLEWLQDHIEVAKIGPSGLLFPCRDGRQRHPDQFSDQAASWALGSGTSFPLNVSILRELFFTEMALAGCDPAARRILSGAVLDPTSNASDAQVRHAYMRLMARLASTERRESKIV